MSMLNFVQPTGSFQYLTDDFTFFFLNKAVIIFKQNALFVLNSNVLGLTLSLKPGQARPKKDRPSPGQALKPRLEGYQSRSAGVDQLYHSTCYHAFKSTIFSFLITFKSLIPYSLSLDHWCKTTANESCSFPLIYC
jgi:hypothetical protein